MSRLGNNLVIPTDDSYESRQISVSENNIKSMKQNEITGTHANDGLSTKSIVLKIISVLVTIISMAAIGLILAYMIGKDIFFVLFFCKNINMLAF